MTEVAVIIFVAALIGAAAFCLTMALIGSYWLAGGVACLAVLATAGATASALTEKDQ